jgi:hypothetical protein
MLRHEIFSCAIRRPDLSAFADGFGVTAIARHIEGWLAKP